MLSDEPIKNKILHRETSNDKSVKLPFLVAVNGPKANSVRVSGKMPGQDLSESHNKKPLKIFRAETLKRAHNDVVMAASIGDLEWLKQTLKIISEPFFDKNGFSTIHVASIHGRQNILQFLIEEKSIDPNFPSGHGWRPIHLCISNQTGERAIRCLRYLVQKGADINATNEDNVTPLHVAATEGQIDCLKALLELRADTQIKDVRGHTALDLAKIWGHRTCGKLLSSVIWGEDKKELAYNEHIERRVRTQDVLKEIERAHFAHYSTKEESEEKFNEWLISQGFKPRNDPNCIYIQETCISKEEATKTDQSAQVLSQSDKQVKNESSVDVLKTTNHSKDWNYSTKPDEKEYITNLNDFYPRNPFTQMPENIDLIMVNRELKGMSLEEVKEFMRKTLPRQNFTSNLPNERPVYYKPKYVKDLPKKSKVDENIVRIDKAGANLTNDPKSFPFKQVKKYLNKTSNRCKDSYPNTESTVKLIKKQLGASDENLNIIRRNHGDELSEYMKDKRSGKMSQKYEKVFIC